MGDPILDELVSRTPAGLLGDEQEPGPDTLYGEGLHKGVKLIDVETYAKHDIFGYRLGLKCELKPGMEYTARIDLERELEANGHPVELWQQEREEKKRKMINDALQALGFKRPITKPITTDEEYNAISGIFSQLIGGPTFDMKIVADGKNSKNEDGTWTFTPNGYTRVAWIKRSRAPKNK